MCIQAAVPGAPAPPSLGVTVARCVQCGFLAGKLGRGFVQIGLLVLRPVKIGVVSRGKNKIVLFLIQATRLSLLAEQLFVCAATAIVIFVHRERRRFGY